MQWFNWLLDCALEEAVRVHGVEARGFAYTTLKSFNNRLPSGYADIFTPQGVAVGPFSGEPQ